MKYITAKLAGEAKETMPTQKKRKNTRQSLDAMSTSSRRRRPRHTNWWSLPNNVGLLGQCFDCRRVPPGNTERALVRVLVRVSPPKREPLRRFLDKVVDAWPDTAGRFAYFAVTQGYGEFYQFFKLWKVSGRSINALEAVELARHCEVRFLQLMTAYEHISTRPIGLNVLSQRSFYPIIEGTEKVSISYSLGSALTGAVADHYFQMAGEDSLVRLFHKDLITSAVHAQRPIPFCTSATLTPDYIGVTKGRRGLQPHVLESKFFESTDYEAIRKGIAQVSAIRTVGGLRPASRSVLASQIRSVRGKQSRVATSMLRVDRRHSSSKVRVGEAGLFEVLNALYLIGASVFLSGFAVT